MDSNSTKHQKICKEVTMEEEEEEMKDRISNLPNDILYDILSFLPTKYAVGTCILSTRWKYLWTFSLHNLDFDDEFLLHRNGHTSRRRKMKLSFTSFVHRVMLTLGNMSYIQRFYLKCDQNYKYSHVNAWICAALQRNVQELDLRISMDDSRVLPRGLFTCATLVSLKLDAELVLYVPSSFGLPKLKTLLLKKIIFLDDDSALMLFSGCPLLEELFILECGCKYISVFYISSLLLKRLILYHCIYLDGYKYKVIIDAPKLEYLQFTAAFVEGSSLKNIESLTEAYLHIDHRSEDQNNVFELIRSISNVKVLHLYGISIRDFLSSHQELPMFPNVTRLELGVKIASELLPDLLQNSPNLEALFFHAGLNFFANGNFNWIPPEQVPHCLLHCLKTIKIWKFHAFNKEELKLVNYFLKNSNVLHQLKTSATESNTLTGEEDLKVYKKNLLMFPMRCKLCQVVLLAFDEESQQTPHGVAKI